MIKKICRTLTHALFPPRCILCDEVVLPEVFLCENCKDKISFPSDERCFKCGKSIKYCECKKHVYHFDKIIAPFYNEGNAQRALYDFKFKKVIGNAEFFAYHMSLAVKKYYSDISFDFVSCVPSSRKGSDYDHSRILAKELSYRLNLPFMETLKPSDKIREIQHTLELSRRFDNVYNAYSSNVPLKGKKILLVDDIKTSGATLDECARQLKLNEADTVCCITALVSGDLKLPLK